MDRCWVVHNGSNILAVIMEKPSGEIARYFSEKYDIKPNKIQFTPVNVVRQRYCAHKGCTQTTMNLSQKYCYLHGEKY